MQSARYTAVGAVMPTYDANGNLTCDGSYTLEHDAENRLVSATDGSTGAAYAFDGRGRRKLKAVGETSVTISVTDADNREVLEYDGLTGAVLRWYAYGLGPNSVVSQINVGTNTPNLLGSVVGAYDSTGALTKYGYQPYGSGSPAPQFAYTGQRIDPETGGLYYYRAKHYSTAFGRFLQPDPVGYSAGSNLYAYVENDPLNFADPTGNCPWCIAGAIGAVLGVGVELAANYGTIRDNIALGNYTAVALQLGSAGAGGFAAGATGTGAVALASRAVSALTGSTVGGSAAVATLSGGAAANFGGNFVSQVGKIATGLQDSYSFREGAFAAATGAASAYAPALIRATPGGAQALQQPLVGGVIDVLSQSKGAGLDLLSKPLQQAPGIMGDFVVSPAYAAPPSSGSYYSSGSWK
jgi:RHS repeat-associated protein